jgi:hypothetical protein
MYCLVNKGQTLVKSNNIKNDLKACGAQASQVTRSNWLSAIQMKEVVESLIKIVSHHTKLSYSLPV